MKKILIIILSVFALTSSTKAINVDSVQSSVSNAISEAKEATVNGVNYVDTSSTFKQMYIDIKSGISVLASSLKVGAEHVYMVLIKQQIVYSIVDLIILIIGLVFIIIWFNRRKSEEEWMDCGDPTGLGVVRALQLLCGAGMFLYGVFNLGGIITGFINPEYGAIMDIIDMTRGLVR